MLRFILLSVLLSQLACASAKSVYVCPTEISANWHVPSPPKGWETVNFDTNTNTRHQLANATFTDGHPMELAFLRSTRIEESGCGEKNGFSTSIYEFSGVSPDGIWLVCRYSNTPAIVMRRLPASHKSCRIQYSQDVPVQSIRCR